MALTTAIFGQSVALVLVGEGVRYLQPHGASTSATDTLALLASLDDYGIQGWAEESALREAGMTVAHLPKAFRAAAPPDIAGLIAASRHLWGW